MKKTTSPLTNEPPAPPPCEELAAAAHAPGPDPALALVIDTARRRCAEEIAGIIIEHDGRGDGAFRASKVPGARALVDVRLALLRRLHNPSYLAQLAAAPGLIVETEADRAYAEEQQRDRAETRAAREAAAREEAELRREWEEDDAFAAQHGGSRLLFENWKLQRAERVAAGLPVGAVLREGTLRVARERAEAEARASRELFLDNNPAMRAAEEARLQRERAAQEEAARPALADMNPEQLRAEVERLRGAPGPQRAA